MCICVCVCVCVCEREREREGEGENEKFVFLDFFPKSLPTSDICCGPRLSTWEVIRSKESFRNKNGTKFWTQNEHIIFNNIFGLV